MSSVESVSRGLAEACEPQRFAMNRIWAVVFAGLAVVGLVLLAAGLPALTLLPGQPFSLSEAGGLAPPAWRLGSFGLSAELLSTLLRAFYTLMVVLLPVAIVWAIVSPRFRKEVLMRLVPVLLIAAFILLRTIQPESTAPPADMLPVEMGSPEAAGPGMIYNEQPPQWFVWATRAGLALLMAVPVGIVAWLLARRRLRPQSTLEQLAQQAQTAIRALLAGAEVEDVILRCYFEMSRVVSEERAIYRAAAMTPREFETCLLQAGLPERPVQDLTRLFEAVRYGAQASSRAEADRALTCLDAIAQACRS